MSKSFKCFLVFVVIGGFNSLSFAADTTPPTLISWSRTPAFVDTSESSAQVVVEMRIVDDDTGIRIPDVYATSQVAQGQATGFASVTRISGDTLDGIWRAVITVPQGSSPGSWQIRHFPLTDNQGNSGGFGPGVQFTSLFTVLDGDDEPPASDFRVVLEEPIDGLVHTGVGNLRGWAIASEAVTRIEILIDGQYAFDAPYGGSRTDVGSAFPGVIGSEYSGFSLAYAYTNLGAGQHSMTARAHTADGEYKESSATFFVTGFHKVFINPNDTVDASGASLLSSGDEIDIENILIDGELYSLKLKWRTAEQGFEIISIQ